MPRYELTCQDCGAPHEVGRKDAKVCPRCRLIRNLEWAAGRFKRARRCRACNALYVPFRPLNRDVATCGECMERADRRDPVLTCPVCRKPTAGTDGVTVCARCVKSPAARVVVIRALRKGQRERRELHAEALAAVKAGGPHLRRK